MPYPKHLINEGEDVALDLRPHWWFFARHIASGAVLVGLFVVWATVLDTTKWLGWPLAVLLVAWLVWVGVKYLDWTFTHFVVTSDRIVSRSGVIAKRGVEIPLERVNNINFSQSIWERIIGAGDLDIESAGKDGASHFDNVRHPDMVQQEIYRQMEINAKKKAQWTGQAMGGGPPSPPAPPPNIPDQIEQLARLRDSGAITPDEFEAKKAELLRRI